MYGKGSEQQRKTHLPLPSSRLWKRHYYPQCFERLWSNRCDRTESDGGRMETVLVYEVGGKCAA